MIFYRRIDQTALSFERRINPTQHNMNFTDRKAKLTLDRLCDTTDVTASKPKKKSLDLLKL